VPFRIRKRTTDGRTPVRSHSHLFTSANADMNPNIRLQLLDRLTEYPLEYDECCGGDSFPSTQTPFIYLEALSWVFGFPRGGDDRQLLLEWISLSSNPTTGTHFQPLCLLFVLCKYFYFFSCLLEFYYQLI